MQRNWHHATHRSEGTLQAFAGGWFHTGDQGFLDGDGFLTLTGRLKELINRGGEKISPLEVCFTFVCYTCCCATRQDLDSFYDV